MAVKVCPSCYRNNAYDEQFCIACNLPLYSARIVDDPKAVVIPNPGVVRCPVCLRHNPLDAYSCTCSYQLKPPPPPEPPSPFDGAPVNVGTVTIPFLERVRGTYIVGMNGTGKSTLMLEMIAQDMENNMGVWVLDPHNGELINPVLDRVPKHREKDVVVFDIEDEHRTWALNLFDCADPTSTRMVDKTVSRVRAAFSKLFGSLANTIGVADLLLAITQTLVANPGTTMADIEELLTNDAYRAKLVKNVQNKVVQNFWKNDYDPLNDTAKRTKRESTMRRIRQFLAQTTIANIVSQPRTSIDFREAADSGKIVLIQFDGELEDETAFLGTMVVLRLLAAAMSRSDIPKEQRRPFFLYADEFHRFATDTFGTMIEEARKYKLGVIMAHQMRAQLHELGPSVASAPMGAPNVILFQVQEKDAAEFAGLFQVHEEDYMPYIPQNPEPKSNPKPVLKGYKPKMELASNPFNLLRRGRAAYTPAVRALIDDVDDVLIGLKLYEDIYTDTFSRRKGLEDWYWRRVEDEVIRLLASDDPEAGADPYIRFGESTWKNMERYGLHEKFHNVGWSIEQLVNELRKSPPLVESLTEKEPIYEDPKPEPEPDPDAWRKDVPSPSQYRQQMIRDIANFLPRTFFIRTGQEQQILRPTFEERPADYGKRQRLRQQSYDRYYFPVQPHTLEEQAEEPSVPVDTSPKPEGLDTPLYDAPRGPWLDPTHLKSTKRKKA